MRREVLTVTGALLVIALLWFAPLLAGEQMGQSFALFGQVPWRAAAPDDLPLRAVAPDVALDGHPWALLTRSQLGDGHLPLWNPHVYGGMTFVGNFQSALFFPLTWLLLVLPLGYAWGVVAVAKMVIAGLGTHLLARELGAGRAGAFVGATTYMLCAPLMVWLQWQVGAEIALFPWLVLALTRFARAPGPAPAAGLALVFALMVFAGHPETTLIAASAAGVFLLALLAAERARALRERLAVVLGAAAALVLGVLAAAVAVVPFLLAYGPSVTRTVDQSFGVFLHVPVSVALDFALPHLFGNGRPRVYGDPFYNAVAVHVAPPALLLAAVAVARGRRRPEVIALVACGVVGAMAVFGLPPVRWIVHELPPWSSINVADRGTFVAALVLSVLGALGFTSVARHVLRPRRVALLVLGGALVVVVGYLAAQLAGELDAPAAVKRNALLIAAVTLAATGGLLLALGRVGPRPALAAALVLVVASVIELRPFNVTLPPDEAYPPTPPAIAALERAPEPFRIGVLRDPEGPSVLPANTLAGFGLDGIEGYDFPLSRRWADFELRVLGFPALRIEVANAIGPPTPAALAGYRMMNTRYFLGAPDTRAPVDGFEVAYRGPDAVVFRDPGALPRAYVVPATRRLERDATLALLARGGHDARRVALVPPDAPAPRAPGARFRPAAVERIAPDHVRVRLAPGSAGWLVLADAYSEEWDARVDGREIDVQPTNFAAMGVPVPAGARTVDFRFDRTGVHVGAALSVLGFALIAALALVGRRRRRAVSTASRRSGARAAA